MNAILFIPYNMYMCGSGKGMAFFMKKRPRGKKGGGSAVKRILIGTAVSVGASVMAILVFALVIMWADLGQDWITPVNQFIKVGSILAGTLYVCRGPLQGYKYGPIMGLIYMALGIVIYCGFDGKLLPITVILGDLTLGAAAGFLSGLLASTFKKEE